MTIRLLDVSTVTTDDNQAEKRSVLIPWMTIRLIEVSNVTLDTNQVDRGQ